MRVDLDVAKSSAGGCSKVGEQLEMSNYQSFSAIYLSLPPRTLSLEARRRERNARSSIGKEKRLAYGFW